MIDHSCVSVNILLDSMLIFLPVQCFTKFLYNYRTCHHTGFTADCPVGRIVHVSITIANGRETGESLNVQDIICLPLPSKIRTKNKEQYINTGLTSVLAGQEMERKLPVPES